MDLSKKKRAPNMEELHCHFDLKKWPAKHPTTAKPLHFKL
jgi:hypothetical protein